MISKLCFAQFKVTPSFILRIKQTKLLKLQKHETKGNNKTLESTAITVLKH